MFGARSFTRSVGFFVVLTAVLGLAACGNDDEEVAGDVTAFCNAYMTMRQASDADEELKTLAKRVEVLVDEVEASAPQEVSEPVGVIAAAIRRAATEGTPKAFKSREVSDARNEVVSYMFDNCEFKERLDVTGVEYAFEGVPDTMSAGLVALRFTNNGEEPHEFILFRKNNGVTESFDDILKLPEGARRDRMTFVSALSVLGPDESRRTVFDAEAGEYIALCFLPVGAPGPPGEGEGPPPGEGEGPPPGESGGPPPGEGEGPPPGESGGPPPGEGEGPPHWVEGKRSEFTVK